jgi:hypothetical protein
MASMVRFAKTGAPDIRQESPSQICAKTCLLSSRERFPWFYACCVHFL